MSHDESGGGGSGRFTYWHGKTIDEMWYMVDKADYAAYGRLITGWKRASELAYQHKSRLMSYKNHIASIWSVEDSEAAKAYIAEIDRLIASVQDIADVAADNQTASSNILTSLYEARSKLKPLYEKHRALNGIGSNGERVPTASPSGESPSAYDPKLAVESQARIVMSGLSTDLSQTQRQFVQPKPYVPPTGGREDPSTEYGPGGTITPLIPVPQTTPTPQKYLSPTYNVSPLPITTGPDLSGLNPTTTIPSPTTTPTTTQPTTIGGTPPGGNPVIGPPPVGPRGKPTTPPTNRTYTPPQTVIGGQPVNKSVTPVTSLRANPPGGLIGGGVPPRAPAAASLGGHTMIGGTGRMGLTSQGIIGPAGGPGGRGATMLPGMGGRPGQLGDGEDGPDYDPDTEWSIMQGVSPVVEAPAATGPVDPGPAIGLGR